MSKLPSINQSFQVEYRYQLHFTHGLFDADNGLLKSIFQDYKNHAVKCIIVIDQGVLDAHPELTQQINTYTRVHKDCIDVKEIVPVEGGERAKVNPKALQNVLNAINNNGICRHSFVLAIGGGAVVDMVGYAANTAHRGVKLIRIPTTVLSQNDAAVGVKNGINYFDKKNFLGSFAPPYAIINDFNFLPTLEQRDWISGIAEAVKVALIKDARFFEFLEKKALAMANREMDAMAHQIHRCAELHMQHIANGNDPFESGSSRPLDFGHWAAHKLEQMTNYSLRHGEAVAMGIALDVTYAHLKGYLTQEELHRILKVLLDIGFELKLPIHTKNEVEELLKGIEEFREHLGGELTITLIKGIGKKFDVHEIDLNLMKRAILISMSEKAISL